MLKKILSVITLAFLISCSSSDIIYKPAPQILPQHIKSIAVRPFTNKSSNYGIEEKLTLSIIDEFLKDGTYKVVEEKDADAVITGEITNYIMLPIQYDSNLVPTVYKITVNFSVKLLDKKTNTYLWEETTLQVNQVFSAPTLPGGITEEQAREKIWQTIAKDIVIRTVKGFGSITGVSSKKL